MGRASKALIAILLAWQWTGVTSGYAASVYPERAIRLVVGFPAGGSSDAIARIVQPNVEKQLGQALVIENRPGAGGAIAIGMVAKAPPDGYLIGLGGAAGLGVSLGVQETAAYDPIKDLAPVTGLASVPFILTASNSLRGKTLREIITMAKQPNNLTIGHGGNGTLMHLTSEMFNQMAGTRIELVPYRGMAPVVTDRRAYAARRDRSSIGDVCDRRRSHRAHRRLFGHSISTSPGRSNIRRTRRSRF